MSDPYLYPGTDVLKNLRGIRNKQALEAFEADSAAYKIAGLSLNRISGAFDGDRLKETHRRIFNDVYEWAGEFRENTGLMYKDRDAGYRITYGDSANVPGQLEKLFTELKDESYLQGLDIDAFSARLAHYYVEIDAIHPFREGNSRTLRVFSTDLAFSQGYRLDWAAVAQSEDERRRLYYARDVGLVRGDYSAMAEIIRKILTALT